jgi:N-methylhydantoinase A/oxoprolinase/acetone carboxylase beta subunit/N-methylhydantoinase B/oxoprolinase/acetone carboxylase alpha subunit
VKWIAADVGGTFTDLAGVDRAGTMHTAKTLTTPHDQSEGILNGVAKLGADLAETDLFLHGSTIAINTVLERTGAVTALITTEGFRDSYEIGRGNRSEPYDLLFGKPVPLVPRRLRREVPERMLADGTVHRPLDTEHARRVILELKAAGVEAVAVCLLHSYANPEHELAIGRLIAQLWPEAYVTLSHEIMREYREYERTSTTVLNAYVGPVVSRYLDSLSNRLVAKGFTGRLLIMQSNGGVMSVDSARRGPVKMMESGPVAGVIGAGALAGSLGMSQLISFDMGGTTAKSSLVKDGEVEISQGYFIGGYATGHPMSLPVVNIVEVGAGGGSIAWIDAAGALKVGPASAGASPGPACYGNGGTRPTVTDANLVLGRLGATGFLGGEMPLDVAAAQDAIRREVAEPLGLDLNAAARGIVAIADAQMSLSVRAVSVEKGEDPRQFALVATGGAGPLHAVSIARELNIGTVVIPVLPGQFSAKGMLSSEVRHDLTTTQVARFEPATVAGYAATLTGLEAEARARLLADAGETDAQPQVQHFVELRYVGQEFTIAVPVPAAGLSEQTYPQVRALFDEMHERLYGHQAPEESVEALGVRTSVSVPLHQPDLSAPAGTLDGAADGEPRPIEQRPVVLDGSTEAVPCPVFDRARLAPGQRIAGPAVVQEATSSVVVYGGDELTVVEDGSLVIAVGSRAGLTEFRDTGAHATEPNTGSTATGSGVIGSETTGSRAVEGIDPITLEVVRRALVAYSDEMATALRRTAYNPMIFEVQDYCVGLVDANAELIAQNLGGLPIFLADLAVSVEDGIARYGLDGFEPGDAIVMNHPYVCGQHLNNVVVYTPCFVDGRVVAFPSVRAHWVDIGGSRVGFGSTASTDIFSEGLQLRSIKVLKAGTWDEDVLAIIRDNIRMPESSLGDLRAAIAACRLGERRITELAERYGIATIEACIAEMRNQSDRLARDAVRQIPDGEYSASSWMDNDGQELDKRVPINVRVEVQGDSMTIDFSDMAEQVRGPINSGKSGGVAAARVAFKTLTLPTHPVDEGAFRNLTVVLPEGKLINARPPAALGQWSVPLPTVVDTVIRALAPALPDKVPAAHKGDMSGFTFHGIDERTGSRFVYLNINGGGWGGRPGQDGPSACVSICQGDVRNIPVEIQETRYPLLVSSHALRADSGGAGENRGGLGLELVVEPRQQMLSNVANERTTCPPWGLHGGASGAPADAVVRRPGEPARHIKKQTGLRLDSGTSIALRTAGGGGWGDPLRRDPRRVVDDVLDGYVSAQAARDFYGVELDADATPDLEATARLRAKLSAERGDADGDVAGR